MYHPVPIQELRAEEGGGLIIHHGLIIRTIRYNYITNWKVHVHISLLTSSNEQT